MNARGTSFVGLVLLPIAVFLPALLSQLLFWRPHSPRAVVLANSPERRRQNEKRADFYTRFGMEDNKRLEGAKLRLVTVELAVTFSVALARLQFDRSIIGVFGWAFIATIGTGLALTADEFLVI